MRTSRQSEATPINFDGYGLVYTIHSCDTNHSDYENEDQSFINVLWYMQNIQSLLRLEGELRKSHESCDYNNTPIVTHYVHVQFKVHTV